MVFKVMVCILFSMNCVLFELYHHEISSITFVQQSFVAGSCSCRHADSFVCLALDIDAAG